LSPIGVGDTEEINLMRGGRSGGGVSYVRSENGKCLDKTSKNIKIYESRVERDSGIDTSMPVGIVRRKGGPFGLPGIA